MGGGRETSARLPLSFGLEFLAIDFLSLRGPDGLSFLGRTLAATAGSTGLMSELEATEALHSVSVLAWCKVAGGQTSSAWIAGSHVDKKAMSLTELQMNLVQLLS